MGLINTVGSLANQGFNLDTLGGDLLNSIKEQVFGIKNDDKDKNNKDTTDYS
jgi:hypothetical protein